MYGQIANFLSPYVFDPCIQNLERLMKIATFIDALKFRLLWATYYYYMHENIRVMNMYYSERLISASQTTQL